MSNQIDFNKKETFKTFLISLAIAIFTLSLYLLYGYLDLYSKEPATLFCFLMPVTLIFVLTSLNAGLAFLELL